MFVHFPNAVTAIDCTEIQIERPHKIPAQRAVYLQYKSHTTMKYLAAIELDCGTFVFMSPGYPDSTSDRAIVALINRNPRRHLTWPEDFSREGF